jgi:hypothetical protein
MFDSIPVIYVQQLVFFCRRSVIPGGIWNVCREHQPTASSASRRSRFCLTDVDVGTDHSVNAQNPSVLSPRDVPFVEKHAAGWSDP